jgi:uncharacterized membrane protein YfcA
MGALVLAWPGAIAIGLSLGLLGSGGSILTVPVLVYLLGQPEKLAIAGSLAIVGTIAAFGSIPHIRAGQVHWRSVLLFGVPGMAGTWLGAWLSGYVSGAFQLALFAVVMLVASVLMLRPIDCSAPVATPRAQWKVTVDGLLVGIVTGLVGVGGGFLVVPALVLLGGLPMGVAVGTSLLVITMKSFAGFAGYLSSVTIPWETAGAVVAAAIVGSVIGGRLVSLIPADRLRKGFAWFVVVMAVFILGQEVPKLFGMTVTVATHWPWLLAAMAAPPLAASLIAAARRQPHAV